MKKGMTLLELIVVMSLIGILITVGIASFGTITQKSRDTQRKEDLEAVRDALLIYYQDTSEYPDDLAAADPSITPTYIEVLPNDPSSNTNVFDCTLEKSYCFIKETNDKFTLWAQLENDNDNDLVSNTDAKCKLTPPSASFNFCVQSPEL